MMKLVWGVVLVAAFIFSSVDADTYLHIPRGSNNRLNEQNRERNNANRLFDSQNNNRGGYNKGGGTNDEAKPMQYTAGSFIDVEWTNQHECGRNNTYCTIILQYMCAPQVRDGTSTGTISESGNSNRNGQHESAEWYAACKTRERNQGLFTADQKLKGNTAKYTRQNPGGTRRGLECPEERDYYPYWVQSPWKDIAILTDQLDRCDEFKRESDNVKAKGYCKKTGGNRNTPAPINQAACTGNGLQWVVQQPHNIPAPECIKAPVSRDNHNGNSRVNPNPDENSDEIPQASIYRWKVPDDVNDRCAFRLRYNISIHDYAPFATTAEHDVPDSDDCISKIPIAATYGIDSEKEAMDRGYYFENDPVIKPLKTGVIEDKFALRLAINTAQTGRVFQDRSHRFSIVPRPAGIPASATVHNLNVRGKRGNIVQVYPAVEYDFAPNDLDIKKDDYVHIQWTGALTNPGNNDGEGQQKTDKSNIINLVPKRHSGNNPAGKTGWPSNSIPQSINKDTFMNLGKSFATAAGLPGLTTAGDELADAAMTKEQTIFNEIEKIEDELSAVMSKLQNKDAKSDDDEDEMLYDDDDESEENDPQRRRRRRRRSTTTTAEANEGVVLERRLRRTQKEIALLNQAPYYVNLGVQKAATCGRWHYLCTRNNNFSNRSQKGRVTVTCPTTG